MRKEAVCCPPSSRLFWHLSAFRRAQAPGPGPPGSGAEPAAGGDSEEAGGSERLEAVPSRGESSVLLARAGGRGGEGAGMEGGEREDRGVRQILAHLIDRQAEG